MDEKTTLTDRFNNFINYVAKAPFQETHAERFKRILAKWFFIACFVVIDLIIISIVDVLFSIGVSLVVAIAVMLFTVFVLVEFFIA